MCSKFISTLLFLSIPIRSNTLFVHNFFCIYLRTFIHIMHHQTFITLQMLEIRLQGNLFTFVMNQNCDDVHKNIEASIYNLLHFSWCKYITHLISFYKTIKHI